MEKDDNIHRLFYGDKEIILIGTAHVSKKSVDLVSSVILEEKPDTVCVELCESRLKSIRDKDRWRNMDIIKVIREKKAFLILSNLLLASFQKKIGNRLEVMPGAEMLKAIETGKTVGANIEPADRDIRVTLSRTWRATGFFDKIKILYQLLLSQGELDKINEAEIEKMKERDALQSILSEIEKTMPSLRDIIIDERDRFRSHRIKNAKGKKIAAAVGAGHIPGIKKYIESDIDIASLETMPKKSTLIGFMKWGFPLLVLALFVGGFFMKGTGAGFDMITWWVLANGSMACIGAAAALAHPATIISSIVIAPLTSLNPMVAAGWVAGLVEAFFRKPKVMDFENLPEDVLSFKGFWKNRVTRILLVVIFTNIGSAIGTFVAIPMLVKIL